MKKATRICTNVPEITDLTAVCSGLHKHRHCMGRVKAGVSSVSLARAAGVYPEQLCEKWAKAVASRLKAEIRCDRRALASQPAATGR